MKICKTCKKEKPETEFYHYRKTCKSCYNSAKNNYRKNIYKNKPWLRTFENIRKRCTYKKHPYFWRGVELHLTEAEIKFLWERDKADTLKKPSIDRIDGNKNYTLDNCRFINLTQNLKRKKTYLWHTY